MDLAHRCGERRDLLRLAFKGRHALGMPEGDFIVPSCVRRPSSISMGAILCPLAKALTFGRTVDEPVMQLLGVGAACSSARWGTPWG
jgi:hypothetical protein